MDSATASKPVSSKGMSFALKRYKWYIAGFIVLCVVIAVILYTLHEVKYSHECNAARLAAHLQAATTALRIARSCVDATAAPSAALLRPQLRLRRPASAGSLDMPLIAPSSLRLQPSSGAGRAPAPPRTDAPPSTTPPPPSRTPPEAARAAAAPSKIRQRPYSEEELKRAARLMLARQRSGAVGSGAAAVAADPSIGYPSMRSSLGRLVKAALRSSKAAVEQDAFVSCFVFLNLKPEFEECRSMVSQISFNTTDTK